VVNATMQALNSLMSPEEAAIRRGIDVSVMQERHEGTA
jgi:ribosomal protein S5